MLMIFPKIVDNSVEIKIGSDDKITLPKIQKNKPLHLLFSNQVVKALILGLCFLSHQPSDNAYKDSLSYLRVRAAF